MVKSNSRRYDTHSKERWFALSDRLQMLRELTEAMGLPGYEDDVRQVISRHVPPGTTVERDNLGSIICRLQGADERPRVMLAGHMDEIGFMVTRVTKEGFLKFQPLGGWWDQVLLAQRVMVRGSSGYVPGIIGSKPPHLLEEEERQKVVKKKNMFIDIGAQSEEAVREMGIRPGDPVMPFSPFGPMNDPKLLMAKAWDDRVGCGLFLDVMKRLAGSSHPNTLYGVGTVLEEVGLRGAVTSAHVVDPDVCLVLESSIAGDMPDMEPDLSPEKLGGGPSILLYDGSMIPNLRLRDLVVETAEAENIPYQYSYMPGGGTDGGRVHVHARGVPCLVIGVPARYIHSHTGIIHMEDFDRASRLLEAVVRRLDAGEVKRLTGD